MKVIEINAVYGQGSTGTIVRDIEHLCEQSGIECYVASPDPKVREAKHHYVIGGFVDHKIHAVLSRVYGMQAYYSHIPTKKFLRWLDEVKPDIVHLHNLHSNYINLNMLLDYLAKKDVKTIVTMHDCWFYTGGCFHYTAVGCYKWMEDCRNCPKKKSDTPAYITKRSARILVDRKKYLLAIPHLYITGVSEWMAHEALKTFLKDIPNYVIPNGIDLEVFKPIDSDLRTRLGLVNKYVILGPASKWLASINKDVLIKFVQQMRPDEVLLLFGVWADSQLNYLNSLNFPEGKVRTYGYINNREELAQLYTMADVFVNTTREDSLSLINVEAQACGTPVVTFDQTGPKETVDDINSFNVPAGDAQKLYESVDRNRRKGFDDDYKKRLISFVADHYEVSNCYKKYVTLFTEVFNGK